MQILRVYLITFVSVENCTLFTRHLDYTTRRYNSSSSQCEKKKEEKKEKNGFRWGIFGYFMAITNLRYLDRARFYVFIIEAKRGETERVSNKINKLGANFDFVYR